MLKLSEVRQCQHFIFSNGIFVKADDPSLGFAQIEYIRINHIA